AAGRGRRALAAARPRPAEHLHGGGVCHVQESEARRGMLGRRNPARREGGHAKLRDCKEGRARANRFVGAVNVRPLSTEGLIKLPPVRFHHALTHPLGVFAWDGRKTTSRKRKPSSTRRSESATSG